MGHIASVSSRTFPSTFQLTSRVIGLAFALALALWLAACGTSSGSRTGAGGSGSGGTQILYAANSGASNLAGYQVGGDGSLTALKGFPLATAQNPQSLSAGGNYLLLANGFSPGSNNGQIVLYGIEGTTGALTQTASFPTNASYVALTSKGDFAYDSEAGIAGYSTAGGKLAALPNSPYGYSETVNGNINPLTPDRLVAGANGKFLYASFYPANFRTPYGDFGVVPINADGTLGAFPAGSPAPSCNIAGGLAVDAASTGKVFVYESCGDPNADVTFDIRIFTVDPASGSLTATSSFMGTAKPGGLASGIAVDHSGKWLIGLDVNHDIMYVLSIDANTGALTQAHTLATGHRPNSVTFDDSGKFLYVSNGDYPLFMGGGSNDISAYAFDASTGNATPLNGSPYAAGNGVTSLTIAH